MNFIACEFQASEVFGTLSEQKQNSFISKTCASGKLSITFISKWSLREQCGMYMFGCGADVTEDLKACSLLHSGQ